MVVQTSVKDLHLREWLLSQAPAEKFDERKLTTKCSNSLVTYSCKLKNNLDWSKDLKLTNFRFLCSSRFHKAKWLFQWKMWPYILSILCLKISWKLGYFRSFFCR